MPMFHAATARLSKTEKLLYVLADGDWHSTKELSRRVGHTFAVFKSHLKLRLHRNGRFIEKRRHPLQRYQYQYRLIDR